MAHRQTRLSRRLILGAGLAPLLLPSSAAAAPKALTFAVFRNGAHIGEHHMTFSNPEGRLSAESEVAMTVRIGPIPVYRYHHHAVEQWRDQTFDHLETTTVANGKTRRVSAENTGQGVKIEGSGGTIRAPENAAPLTHWNSQVFGGPLFNPQEGKMLKVRASRIGEGHWTLRGETEIDDWYDASGVWRALKGKLEDGSVIEYRRV